MSKITIQKDRYEVEVEIRRMTDKAILVDDGTARAWLPLSQVRTEEEIDIGEFIMISIPEWLAKEKELI